jgi:hypothetical protein
MATSKFPSKNRLREGWGIFNHHNLCSRFAPDPKIAICYLPRERFYSARWSVWSPLGKTNPGGAWYEHGCKTFLVWSASDKEEVLAEAMKWAAVKYGIAEWAKDPFGGYQDVRTLVVVKEAQNKA